MMKLAIFMVACIAMVTTQSAFAKPQNRIADKIMMEKQRFIFEILLHVDRPLLMEEWIKMGDKLINEESNYLKYDKYMKKFYKAYQADGVLPKGEFFSVMTRLHMVQSLGLFNFFYYAKDFETFVRNVAFARINFNEGMFVYALSMAAIHRQDMQGVILPQIHEIFPSMFFNGKYIMKAEKFDYKACIREMLLKKEMPAMYDKEDKMMNKNFENMFYMRDWKVHQWWNLMGIGEGFHKEDICIQRDGMPVLKNDQVMLSICEYLNMMYMPVDYTRDIEFFNEDTKMSYFTEDIGWNSYFYYLNLDYSKMLFGKEFNLDKDRRGEFFLYNIQQILARYYMERLSNGLGEFEKLNMHGMTVKSGYNPQLMLYTGHGFSVRKNYYEIESYKNVDMLRRLSNAERRIDDVIDSGRYTMKNGTIIDFKNYDGIEYIGNMMQGTVDILDKGYLGHWWVLSCMYLSGEKHDSFGVLPNVMLNYETMLRDPISYKLFKTMVEKYYMFKNKLPPYTREELLLPGVLILDVEIDKLMTYFDLVDMDITTLMNEKMIFHDGRYVWDKALLARQMRLNHEEIKFSMKVSSDKIQKVVVRIFLGPEFNSMGRKLLMSESRENYMELDEFLVDLVVGENIIHRSSEDFEWTSSDRLSYSEMYNYLIMAYDGKTPFYMNISEPHPMFPDRLILPCGWTKGMPMAMFFVVSPYTADYEQYATYDPSYMAGIGSGVRRIDKMPFGYPLDKQIEDFEEFFVPNMYIKSVRIYHKDKLDKYFPIKYENYGKFDYNY